MQIVEATIPDATPMGHFMVETWLEAHRPHIVEEHWQRRREEWTPELSAAGWANTLAEMSDGTRTRTCIYLARDASGGDLRGLVMGAPANHGPWRDAAQVSALYIHRAHRGQGIGRDLLATAVTDLVARGFQRLVIGCLETNTPGRAFYEHLGGTLVGQVEDEEYGFTTIQLLYGWPDITTLLE